MIAFLRLTLFAQAQREAAKVAPLHRARQGPKPTVCVADLLAAAHAGDTATIMQLLNDGAAIDAADETGATALHLAAVQALLAAGADVNARIFYGLTPLMLAAGGGEAAVCEVLLNAGAEVKAAYDGGRTALAMAKERFLVDVINLLHEAEGFVMETEGGGSCASGRKGPQSDAKVVSFIKRPLH